jgi:glycosyltransferase involved in cell wall biosynthesis
MEDKLVSVVIPCYNEENNINRTLDQLLALVEEHPYQFEIIVVDDGSLDNSWQVIKDYAENHPHVIGVNEATNYGQSASYQAGFDLAKGEYIVTLSADLEIPIKNVTKVISFLDEGYDFVNTHRVAKKNEVKGKLKIKSTVANKMISWISKVDMKDRGSGLKGIRQTYVKKMNLYGDMHRFIPDYLSMYGAKMLEFEVEYLEREYGQSAYSRQNRTLKVLLDLLTLSFMLNFASKPFWFMPGRFFGFSGIIISGIGTAMGIYLVGVKLFLGEDIGNRPLLSLAILMMIIGFQSIMFGLLGELMMRIYFESSGRKTYTIREIIE